eukprot:g15536.t1
MRERNAEALGKSLCISCTVPCIISAIFFSMLFCTYPRDKMRQHEDSGRLMRMLSDVTFDAEPLQHQNGDGTSEDVEKLMIKWGYGLGEGEEATNSTVDGDAAAFDLKLLPELYEVKGADNSSLQHWIFSEFFDSVDSRAADFLEAFSPMLQNVSRKVLNDEAKVSKGVHLTLEECDEALSGLEAELCRVQDELQRCLEPLDATDPVKRRLQREFTTATASMAAVGQQRDALKVQFGELLKWLQMTETRSADFCLMWDNFLLPPDLLVARHQDAYKNNTFEELFCQGETFSVQEFQAIWELDRTYGTFGEEGDPPFQRQLSRSPAGSPAEASPSTSHLSQLQLIPLPWTKIEVSSGHSVWNAVQAQVASPIPQAELLPRFSAKAVAEAQEQRLAKEAKFQHEPSATQSQGEALPNVKDPETLKDPEEARSLQQEPHVVLTSFVASYSKTLEACSKPLEDLLDVAQCFLCSEVLPDFLALVLATGNYLNGGTARGQADGFDLSEMSKLQGIQDFDGKDLRHFIFEVFCRQMPCQAEQFFKDLRPCFQNVRKAISKDAMGTARLEKTVVHDLETLDEQVSQLQRDLAAAQEALSSMADHLEGEADNLEKAAVYVGEVVVLRDAAQAEFEKLFSFLSMKAMRTADFCLLWDNLFLPGDLMVNKGKDDYFIPAFCCQEPFQREHIEVLWGLHIPGEAEQSEQASMEGPLDAQQFCAALIPLVQSPEDFSNNATAFSACPGTRSNGGDLGEVERGQMHPAIEAVLFDPELELRVPLGPVETDAGYHLIMARKKCKGILSTTVSASHILVKHGRYKPPACEASIHLPNLVGEEGDVARTWRRWSFAHSLPPALSHLAEAQDEAEQLQQKRLALQGQPGLRLLFRWEGAFVFNIKGILSDISGDMVGPINLVDGSIDSDSRMKLGNLLTLDEARALNAEKDGFDGRLQWIETSWQDAAGILDSASMCTAEILLHRSDADGSHGRKTGPSVRLRVKPTKLAYAASEPGLRLGLSSSIKVQDRVATLVKQLETGEVLVKVDNGEEEIIDPRPRTVVAASSIARAPGIQILLLHDGEHLLHAEVEESARKQNLLRHIVVHNGTRQEFDLNEMNHSLQRFSSAQEFEEARMAYCRQIMEDGRYIEDAITGNRVDISEQIVRVEMQVRRQSDAETLRHMPFDDLEWVSDSSFRLGERVWAQGREGTIEHLQKHNRYMVKFSDGSSSPALHASSIKRAQAIAGVQDRSFAKVQDIAEIVPLLLHPCRLQGRLHGAHSSQPVLIRAEAGTGKTWSMQQLLFLLASELSRPEKDSKLRLVPLLIPIQKLARMLRKANSEEGYPSNLVLFYIQAEFSDGRTRRLLEQAFEMRSLIVMLDGIDEAASMKLAVEDYVTKTLVPMGVPLLVTSRPEGIRKRLYSRDFVIMNLKPLGQDQQHKIIEKQLQKNNFFRHLLAFHGARREQEKTFKDSFSPQQVEQIEKALQATLVRLLELMAQLAQQPDELEQGFHHECIYSIPKFCEPVKHWTLLFLACFSRSDAFLRPQLSHLEAVQQDCHAGCRLSEDEDSVKDSTEAMAWAKKIQGALVALAEDLTAAHDEVKLELGTSGWRQQMEDLIQETSTINTQTLPVGVWHEKCGPKSRMDVEDVIKAMKASVGNPQVQEKGFDALNLCVEDPKSHIEVARLDGIAMIVKAMEQHQMEVAKSGAAQAVLDAMRAHCASATIQELGCQALKEFAAFNAESQEDIYVRGGIQVVLRAMESYPELPNLQVMGCGVLRNLAACNSQQQQAVVSRGGIQVVMDAMSAHKDHALMQWAGCWTLFCLCVHNAEMRSEVYAYGAARAALKALEAHRLEARVQEAGCWLLKEPTWPALKMFQFQ